MPSRNVSILLSSRDNKVGIAGGQKFVHSRQIAPRAVSRAWRSLSAILRSSLEAEGLDVNPDDECVFSIRFVPNENRCALEMM